MIKMAGVGIAIILVVLIFIGGKYEEIEGGWGEICNKCGRRLK